MWPDLICQRREHGLDWLLGFPHLACPKNRGLRSQWVSLQGTPMRAQTKKGHAAFRKNPLSNQMWYYLNEKRGEKELYLCQILENVSQIEKEQRDFSLKFLLLPASHFKILAFIRRISKQSSNTHIVPQKAGFLH